MSFYGVKTWFMKLYTKDLNNRSLASYKGIKSMYIQRPYENNHECLERDNLPILKYFVTKKVINFAFSLFQ